MTGAAWAAAFVAAFLISAALARSGPVDGPRDRGSHRTPTPTTGGLAVLAASALGAALVGVPRDDVTAALALAAALGLYAGVDDLFDLGALPKLLAQVAASAVFAFAVAVVIRLPFGEGLSLSLPWILGVAGTALWLIVLGNCVNFMDGADGLAAGATAVASAAVAGVALWRGEAAIAAAAAALAGGSLGFLPFNLGRRLFQGDVGALFASFLLGALGVLLTVGGGATPYLVPLAILPLLVDALGTLALRLMRREPVWRPHKQHLYHRWLAAGRGGHVALAVRVWLLTALTSTLAIVVEVWAPNLAFATLAAAAAVLTGGWLLARRSLGAAT